MNLVSFHGDSAVKKKYVDRVKMHRKADDLIRGQGWTADGKGCAVGCTLEKYDHKAYETELGIPEWLARVEDTLYEYMTLSKSKTWPEKFLMAIKPGVDLEQVKTPFLIMVLKRCLRSMDAAKYDKKKFPQVKEAIEQSRAAVKEMIKCHKEGKNLSAAASAAESAESAAWSAAESAGSAARSAAWSAAWSAAASAAESAGSAARSAAWSAAESAESAAASAAWSAESAESAAWSAAESAGSAARSAAYDEMADALLELLKKAK